MIPTKQTVLHSPENGKIGNCLSAVIASLLHMPIEDVPVFYAPSPIWQKELNSWLRQFGLAYLQVADFDQWCSSIGIEGCYSEIGGSTTRSHDVAHAVVGKDGAPIFDPHPDDSGLSSIESSGIFLALRPWETVRAATDERIEQLRQECNLLADVLRDAYEVIKTVEGENSDEDERLHDLRMIIEAALSGYQKDRIAKSTKQKAEDRTMLP